MQLVDLLVSLKVPDVTALTAAGALRRAMGYQDVLKGLKRADFYRFQLDVPDKQQATRLVTDIAENTNLFVNPNKHTFEVHAPEETASPGSTEYHEAKVLVTASDGRSATAAIDTLRDRLGYGDVVNDIVEGVLWVLQLDVESPRRAREIAREIAVTESRESGLLINPHYQDYEIL